MNIITKLWQFLASPYFFFKAINDEMSIHEKFYRLALDTDDFSEFLQIHKEIDEAHSRIKKHENAATIMVVVYICCVCLLMPFKIVAFLGILIAISYILRLLAWLFMKYVKFLSNKFLKVTLQEDVINE